ncbi:ABC transporter ATP-binding protein [Plasticicumulans sp.]|uniref:ABC transporter ATP-binding protein n=1 Tax=Plasticicumulans sp. TaxID=2307179 RepID=UPI000FB84244|nr:ABC transporter ATP-binding protein [Plasticicumulans sp.]RTL00704.1 MAG: ABC transporter ATP-binding protein [Xanthomonadales bacterium]HNM42694.1 ABC transporter ATP-binding protein [Plasticicumulans sp.]HNO62026.1 ABC transporter ATP-binding protein [Plasticicumulans sp.]
MTAPSPLLQLRKVCRGYAEGHGQRPVLAGAELALLPGEVVALLGASGSGKSTLLNLAAGIDLPDAGEVCFDGRDLARLSETARTRLRRRQVGIVFQFFNLVPTLTVAENARLPLELNGLADAAGLARVASLLDAVGLADAARRWPGELSGGEQQRVALVRALVHRPKLLLADEPTGALDAENGARVLDLLLRLAREHAATVLIVTHAAEVAAAADRRLRLADGRLHAVDGAA